MKRYTSLFLLFLSYGILQCQNWSHQLLESCKEGKATCEGFTIQADGEAIILQSAERKAVLSASPDGFGLPKDWALYDSINFDLVVRNDAPLPITFSFVGRRSILPFRVSLEGPSNIKFPLRELPLTGSQYAPEEIRIVAEGSVYIQLKQPKLHLREGRLYPVVDSFGQRLLETWPDKIKRTAQLQEQAQIAQNELALISPPENRDGFGGWTSGQRFDSTGFFRLQKGTTRDSLTAWWLVTPDGYPFWSLGVTGLRNKSPWYDVTPFQGREHLFEALPPDSGLMKEAYEGDTHVSFYTWNVLRKWGSLNKWRAVCFERLQRWGINTLGNWAAAAVLESTPIPYTRALRSNTGTGVQLRVGESRFPDVFDPAWAHHLDTAFALTRQWKEDPLLVGYFVDNEMHWDQPMLLENASGESALRRHWESLLKQRYTDLVDLNNKWGTKLSNWSEARTISSDFPRTKQFERDRLKLEEDFAEAYFQKIAQTLAKHDPNHLYLGCRFTHKLKPLHVIESAGRWCDLISVNVYSYQPLKAQMEAWHKLSGGRPLLIGEHHVPLDSKRQLPPKYPNFTAEERYQYYINYVKTWAEMPFAVGCHWYQFKDQPLTGRGAVGGENQTVGLVDITDQPHKELVEAIRAVSQQVYQWHKSATQ
jgi:hypothetical protein